MNRNQNHPATLCWRCENAVPDRAGLRGCTWSRRREPVPGWDAEQTWVHFARGIKNKNMPDGSVSYYVKACPEFIADKEEKE